MKLTMPKYDAELVAAIEEHLDQANTTVIDRELDARDGTVTTFARGRRRKSYPRPMFQVLPDTNGIAFQEHIRPCPACDRWDRSWSCPDHPEVPWDTKLGCFVRPEPGARPARGSAHFTLVVNDEAGPRLRAASEWAHSPAPWEPAPDRRRIDALLGLLEDTTVTFTGFFGEGEVSYEIEG